MAKILCLHIPLVLVGLEKWLTKDGHQVTLVVDDDAARDALHRVAYDIFVCSDSYLEFAREMEEKFPIKVLIFSPDLETEYEDLHFVPASITEEDFLTVIRKIHGSVS